MILQTDVRTDGRPDIRTGGGQGGGGGGGITISPLFLRKARG